MEEPENSVSEVQIQISSMELSMKSPMFLHKEPGKPRLYLPSSPLIKG
jgi:hypothetical protein